MIEQTLVFFTKALYGSPHIALSASFIWGVLSILLSPCHLSSIPLIVGFIGGSGRPGIKRAFFLSFLFSSGILITIAIIGLITGLLGRILGDTGPWGNRLVGLIFVLIGFNLLGVLPLPFIGRISQPDYRKKGYLAAFILGLVFGVALGPCTFSFMAPMLGIVFSMAKSSMLYAAALIMLYAAGHCSVIVFAGTFSEAVEKYLKWDSGSRGAAILKKVCGVLVILGGVYLIYGSY